MQNVLLIDNELNYLSALKEGLEQRGYYVKAAENGYDGYLILRTEPIDCVITDLAMPGGGEQFVRHLISLSLPAPIIVITGNADEKEAARIRRYGAKTLLHKPVTLNEVDAAVTKAIFG